MATSKLTGRELLKLGYPQGPVIGTALHILDTHYKGKSKQHKLELLERVISNPSFYKDNETLAPLVIELTKRPVNEEIPLKTQRMDYSIFGSEEIEAGALNQMEIAMKLPVTKAGALMPDAHQGYGLPIGGVLATKNEVIPYGVGVDIGCRMCLTLYDRPAGFIGQNVDNLRKILIDNTRFGRATFKSPMDDAVLERSEFREIKVLRDLKDRAYSQIGSSGGGNHFVEFGIVELTGEDPNIGLPKGNYLAVLSHSGSRGLGANIAGYYTKLAMNSCKLPGNARHLAWLDLNTQEGQEYWLAMNLAGDYASACHHHIHRRLARALGEEELVMIENHHNFAWKEKDKDGEEIIVHRKGATPAGKGVLGIIPGSMTAPGFIVRGKGDSSSVNSASHGAGRRMSRTHAKNTLSPGEVAKQLRKAGVELIGSGLDEAPMAYKNIHDVMDRQQELVEVLGTFQPKIVRMCGDEKFKEVD